jgi:hypothetical protein
VQGERALLKLSWLPTSQKESLANTLKDVLQSYKSRPSTSIPKLDGTGLQLPVSQGWLFTETERSATAHSGDQSVSLARLDFSSADDLDSALDDWIQLEKDAERTLDGLKALGSEHNSADDVAGRRWNTSTRFVSYESGSASFRAALTAAYTDTLGNTVLIVVRRAPEKDWLKVQSQLLLIEQGATNAGLTIPVYATEADGSVLTGTPIRSLLAQTSAKRWQSLLLDPVELSSPTGDRFLAPRTARNPETGTFQTTIEGAAVELQPLEME